jgi:DNA ligase-1
MRRFSELYEALDATTSTNAKVAALVRYFTSAPPEDAAWALYFLTGRRLKRLLPSRLLQGWTLELTATPPWLFQETYASVGDLAETVALLLDQALGPAGAPGGAPDGGAAGEELPLRAWVEERLLPLAGLAEAEQRARVTGWWRGLPRQHVFLLNKLMTGELRVGVSDTLVVRAIAQVAGLEPPAVAHRLMGTWAPSAAFFEGLLARDTADADRSRPYPFFLASPLEAPLDALGPREEWLAEWKWDGIRGQLVRRGGGVHLWSRGEELVTDRFPEVSEAARALPEGTVLDGEVLAYRDGRPLPFALLQRRIGRQKLTPKVLAEAPVVFMAYDLLEEAGEDVRERPLSERRARLAALVSGHAAFPLSPALEAGDWEALARVRDGARERQVEGFMLKRLASPYRAGRKRGDWWKWKVQPFAIDAVMLYAHPGHGRRSSLYTDYTFGVWQGGELTPIAKAYSGLTDAEISKLDRWIRQHTREKYGPTRAVEPTQVFELHFEGLQASPRHRSGVALRFPRIARWRHDKPPAEATTLDEVKGLLDAHGPAEAAPL